MPLYPNRYFSIDIAFVDKKIGIEVNGNQHYNKDGSLRSYYQKRHDLIEQTGWKLIELHYSKVYNINLNMFSTGDNFFEDDSLEVINLKRENEELKTKLIDLTFEMNHNKQTELLEFLRQLYESTCEEMNSNSTKKEILFSLKKNIEEFAKDNKISL